MILIIGGAYQGKTEFACARFGLKPEDVFVCTEETDRIDLSKRCVCHLERFALGCVRRGEEPKDAPDMRALKDAVLISDDVSCGIVPVDDTLRAWREACGRMNNALAREADEVWRLFCGIPQRLK